MSRREVHLVQVNSTFGRSAFLPYSVGLLRAYAETDDVIRDNYEFKDFVFLREPIADVLARMRNPDVVGLSCYIWNWNYSRALGAAVKERFPNCLMVLGGPHVPVNDSDFLKRNDWADLLIRYEGEITFAEVLRLQLSGSRDFAGVRGVAFRGPRGEVVDTPRRDRVAHLDSLPSPYLNGVFDRLMDGRYDFQATQETHRGCPFSCTRRSATGEAVS